MLSGSNSFIQVCTRGVCCRNVCSSCGSYNPDRL